MLREILINPLAFIAYVGIVYFILRLILVTLAPLDSIGWKRADYLWLSAALIGALPIVLENQESNASVVAEEALRDTDSHYWIVRQTIDSHQTFMCHPSVRSPFSPDDFDERVVASKRACEDTTTISQNFPDWSWEEPPPLNWIAESYRDYEPGSLKDNVERLNGYAGEYEERRKNLIEVRQAAEPSVLRGALIFFSPLFIGFAIALRLAKVSGEIHISRGDSHGAAA